MKSTDKKARSRMMAFVAVIFTAAVVIAGIYFLFFTPGEPESQGLLHSADQVDQRG